MRLVIPRPRLHPSGPESRPSHRRHRGSPAATEKIDYTPRRAAFPHTVAPFIPPFMCTIGILLFFSPRGLAEEHFYITVAKS